MKKSTPDNGPASDDHVPDARANTNPSASNNDTLKPEPKSKSKHKAKAKGKPNWGNTFWCFECGKRGQNLPRCQQCAQAFYCDADCQRKHWRKHKPVCRAAVAALARRAHRERLARAVREKGRDKVEGAAEDDLCVICQAEPVDPVEVRPQKQSK